MCLTIIGCKFKFGAWQITAALSVVIVCKTKPEGSFDKFQYFSFILDVFYVKSNKLNISAPERPDFPIKIVTQFLSLKIIVPLRQK